MRRIINSTYVTLDGVIEHLEKWHFEYLNDDSDAYLWEQLSGSDALLMGRVSYEGHAVVWPGSSDRFADKINGMKKYVASTTLREAEWANTTVIDSDLVNAVTTIKNEPGEDILMWGFGPVAETLLRHGLLDELSLWIHPVLVGLGETTDLLFRAGNASKLSLKENRSFDTGLVILTYEPIDVG